MGSEYGDFQARFQYYPNGLLETKRALSVHPSGEICDYDHTYWFVYDSDLHVIQQNDTYYGDWIRLNKETRGFSEDSLLLTRQNDPYNDSATLITYGYDEQGHRVSALTHKRYNGVWENQK